MTEKEVKALIQELRDEIPAIIEEFNKVLKEERKKLNDNPTEQEAKE